MDTTRAKIEHDKLAHLAAASNGVLAVTTSANMRHYDVTIHVPAPVGLDRDYRVENEHHLTIDLPDSFPASGPLLQFNHPILAVNIWENGVPCIAINTWFPGQHLDQVLCDLIEEMQGRDPNFNSPANLTAEQLYSDPAFVVELQQRLGPPVRLAPPAETNRSPISTVSTASAPSAPGLPIQTMTSARRIVTIH